MTYRSVAVGFAVLMFLFAPIGSAQSGFEATFTPKAGNEWWVEVNVKANAPLARVEARVDSGTWQTLTLRSWGAWAASFHIPTGSVVTFRATSTDGAIATSGGYVWPGATPVDSTTSDFDASFSPRPGNEWWVEVYVQANEPLSSVMATKGDGAWHTLTKRSWGAWAGSFHIPAGSSITFRATSTDGDTDTSAAYRWPEATLIGESPPPPVNEIAAAFAPKAGNEWWTEVFVITTGDIAKVEASANGGTWHTLTLRDWGPWAGSFHIPSGSTLRYRVTTNEGTATSTGFHSPSGEPVDARGTPWPQEGSYAYYSISWSVAPGYYGHVDATFIQHGGEWWVHCVGEANERSDPQIDQHERFAPPHGPTDVATGEQVTIGAADVCRPNTYTLDVTGPATQDLHQNGQPVTAATWHGEYIPDCNCNNDDAEWSSRTGIVIGWHNSGTSWSDGLLLDTDAPIR